MNRRHDAISQEEKERSRLLVTIERKEKLRTGVSEIEKELREAGKDLWQVTLERRRIEAKERRETDAAGGGVT